MQHYLDPARLTELLRHVWPGVSQAEVRLEQISHHDHADHWLVIHHDARFVLRVAHSLAAARRVVSALEALDGATYAPLLLSTSLSPMSSDQLIGMEYIEGVAPSAADVQHRLDNFIEAIRDLHRNDKFRVAVESAVETSTKTPRAGGPRMSGPGSRHSRHSMTM